jgi:hypothetical protein
MPAIRRRLRVTIDWVFMARRLFFPEQRSFRFFWTPHGAFVRVNRDAPDFSQTPGFERPLFPASFPLSLPLLLFYHFFGCRTTLLFLSLLLLSLGNS